MTPTRTMVLERAYSQFVADAIAKGLWIRRNCHELAKALADCLKGHGMYAKVRRGTVEMRGERFPHSWVEVEGLAIDVACHANGAPVPMVFAVEEYRKEAKVKL